MEEDKAAQKEYFIQSKEEIDELYNDIHNLIDKANITPLTAIGILELIKVDLVDNLTYGEGE